MDGWMDYNVTRERERKRDEGSNFRLGNGVTFGGRKQRIDHRRSESLVFPQNQSDLDWLLLIFDGFVISFSGSFIEGVEIECEMSFINHKVMGKPDGSEFNPMIRMTKNISVTLLLISSPLE